MNDNARRGKREIAVDELLSARNHIAQLGLFLGAAFLSVVGTRLYARYAVRQGITAQITSRSLHKEVVPRGGGVVFASVFSLCIMAAWLLGMFTIQTALLLGVGGVATAWFGFLDDALDIGAAKKFVVQSLLAGWGFAMLARSHWLASHIAADPTGGVMLAALVVVAFVWFINLYNFIDGIDGMAASGAVYVSVAAIVILMITRGEAAIILAFAVLAASALGFLSYNLPPARIFMGDSGSIFLGYTIVALAIATVASSQMSIWTWMAILSYFIGDTTVTNAYRLIFVDKWYRAHRSHAYQNLARIYGSHSLVTYGVNLYNWLWAFPMAVWGALVPKHAPLAAMFAVGPVVLWTLRFGPRLSSN